VNVKRTEDAESVVKLKAAARVASRWLIIASGAN